MSLGLTEMYVMVIRGVMMRRRRRRRFTIGRDEGKALVLASFPLAVTDVEVDMDRSGESLVPIWRDVDQERILQQRKTT